MIKKSCINHIIIKTINISYQLLCHLNRRQLYSDVHRYRRENHCLNDTVDRYRVLVEKYEKLVNCLDPTSTGVTIADDNDVIDVLKREIQSLRTMNSCSVSLDYINELRILDELKGNYYYYYYFNF